MIPRHEKHDILTGRAISWRPLIYTYFIRIVSYNCEKSQSTIIIIPCALHQRYVVADWVYVSEGGGGQKEEKGWERLSCVFF